MSKTAAASTSLQILEKYDGHAVEIISKLRDVETRLRAQRDSGEKLHYGHVGSLAHRRYPPDVRSGRARGVRAPRRNPPDSRLPPVSRAALRRALQNLGATWELLPNGVEARRVAAFPRDRWSLVVGATDDGTTISNLGESSATSLAGAVREAEKLANEFSS